MKIENQVESDALVTVVNQLVKEPRWFALALMYLLTKEQWNALMSQKVYRDLRDALSCQVRSVTKHFPFLSHSATEDATSDVMLKLVEFKFLKRFDPQKGHPCPYLLGSARQYARTIARSLHRQYRHDNGLPPLSSRCVGVTPTEEIDVRIAA